MSITRDTILQRNSAVFSSDNPRRKCKRSPTPYEWATFLLVGINVRRNRLFRFSRSGFLCGARSSLFCGRSWFLCRGFLCSRSRLLGGRLFDGRCRFARGRSLRSRSVRGSVCVRQFSLFSTPSLQMSDEPTFSAITFFT